MMFRTLRKINYPFSSFWKDNFSCARRGAYFSTSNLRVLQQLLKGENDPYVTKDGVQYDIRPLAIADIPQLSRIKRQMNTSIVETCLESWIKKDPNGIKVAVTGKDEIIGAISLVKCDDSDSDGLYFGGLLFVKPEHQNKGIANMLWKVGSPNIGNCNTGLNTTLKTLPTYQDAWGFHIHDTRVITMDYNSSSWPLDFTFLTNTPPTGITICPFDSSHLPSIFAYDFDLIGFKRTSALALNLMEAGSRTLVALRSDGTCAGFGTMKVNLIGIARVGPLYADGPVLADVLLRRLVEMVMHEQVVRFRLVTFSANHHAMQWMDRLGIEVDIVGERLYTKRILDVDMERVYGQFDYSFQPF